MKTVGIICEYNPFHGGHLHQIEQIKSRGDAVLCLMSGHVTQRGSFAVADKFTRAKSALLCGADLVLELPFPFSSSGAEFFAAAGVSILDSLGVDEINFGSECGDAAALRASAELTSSPEFAEKYRSALENDPTLGTAQAFFSVCRELGVNGNADPNDILGISYFRAALRIGCADKLTVIKREGAGYNESTLDIGKHPSATALRRLMENGELENALHTMPAPAAEAFRDAVQRGLAPTDTGALEGAILSFFRLTDPSTLENIAEAGGGLAHRLCSAAHSASSLEEFFGLAASKRYTSARIRRAAVNCMVGVNEKDLRTPPAYVQLLAANARGRELLSSAKKNGGIPIVTKPADAELLGGNAPRQAELSTRVDVLFTLAQPKMRPTGEYTRRHPFISD